MSDTDITHVVTNLLGHPARLISHSKTAYCRANPDNHVVFNAIIYLDDGTPIWHGDLDLTIDSKKIQALANKIQSNVTVYYERAKFDGLKERYRARSFFTAFPSKV